MATGGLEQLATWFPVSGGKGLSALIIFTMRILSQVSDGPAVTPTEGLKATCFPTFLCSASVHSSGFTVRVCWWNKERSNFPVEVRDMAGALRPRWKQDFMENLFLVKTFSTLQQVFHLFLFFWQAIKLLCMRLLKSVNFYRKHCW